MDNQCKCCKKSFESEKSLHGHLRAHHLSVPDYYQKFYPRYDKWTRRLIDFKNKDFYFTNDFNTRENLINYFTTSKKTEITELKNLTLKTLSNRKEDKELKYALSQVELKSLIAPSVTLLEHVGFDYNKINQYINLPLKFEYGIKKMNIYRQNLLILQDTREQKPLKFNCPIRKQKLSVGDYSCGGDAHVGVFIERKSVGDFIGTLSGGYERFEKEVKRAKDFDQYLFVLVEEPMSAVMNPRQYKGESTPEFIFHRMREIMQNHDHIQFVFCEDRQHMSNLITTIFYLGQGVKKMDMQYLIDKHLC